MPEQTATVDVPQERVPQARALGSALNQPRDVGGNKAALPRNPHHPEIRGQRGEMIVRNLRLCRADPRQERGLAHARVADDPHIRKHFQLQNHLALLALRPVLRKHRDLPRGGCKVAVAPSAAPTATGNVVRAVLFGHIVNDLPAFRVTDHRPRGN